MGGLSNLFGGDIGGADNGDKPSGLSDVFGDENGQEESHEGADEHDPSLGTDTHDGGDAAHSLGLDDSLA